MTEVLATRGITKAFGALMASRDVSLSLRVGEIHALIGPNGAGKSTLMGVISGALQPDCGQVLIDGADVTALDRVARARAGLGRSFQISEVAGGLTVFENVLIGALGAAGKRPSLWRPVRRDAVFGAAAHAALKQVGLVGRNHIRAADLSHGERRLLELAVALTLKPRAFLLDEPMAGLGGAGTQHLTDVLDQLRHTAPILLVEHDMDAVFALADRITVLVEGAVIASGTGAEIRADPAVRHAYLGDGT